MSQVRGRVWPLLLGVEPHLSPEAEEEYLEARCAKHADSSVVECDIQRSLWSFTEGKSWRIPRRFELEEAWYSYILPCLLRLALCCCAELVLAFCCFAPQHCGLKELSVFFTQGEHPLDMHINPCLRVQAGPTKRALPSAASCAMC